MNNDTFALRPATPDDAEDLAQLINYAGEGLPLYLWTGMAEPGEDPWQVGRARARRDVGGFSWRNSGVAEHDGAVLGCLVGYPLAAEPAPDSLDGLPPMFVPLQELENLAPNTWYVNVLAVYPEQRGRGVGSRLLERAEQAARDTDRPALSLIVSDANPGARRLYERSGYRVVASRPIVHEGWQNDGVNWVLMVRTLDE